MSELWTARLPGMEKLSPDIVLCKTGLDIAIDIYKVNTNGELPAELIVNSSDDTDALTILVTQYNWLNLHFIRRLPWGFWMLTGIHGVVWSNP